jgi:alkanesulfonate monooxygenase SsuD/methylene tetrahydromethanopterin reductase-like flavin-dependent oxidoreductase (luciferase family)
MRGARFFASSMAQYYLSGKRPLGKLAVPRDFLPEAELAAAMAERNAAGSAVTLIVGDPSSARETVERFKDIGVDELILVMQMGTVPHEIVMESLRTFAEKVMPHFA